MTTQTHSIDKVLSSSGRIRILSLLSTIDELHLSEIAKRTEQSYSATERHLMDLSEADMVEEKDYGRVRIFRLNASNPRAQMLRNLVVHWNDLPDPGRNEAQA